MPDAHELLIHDCEDCACPVTENQPLWAPPPPPSPAVAARCAWVSGLEVVERQVDAGHWLLFNPLGRGGVVVVNEAGRRVFHAFRQPITLAGALKKSAAAGPDLLPVFRRLAQLQMVHPADQPPFPQFTGSTVLTAWVHVTNACNLRCPYCYVHKSREHMDGAVADTAVDAIMQTAAEHGFEAVKLKYAGGEASLNSHVLMSLHARARSLARQRGLRLHASLLSNGVALSRELVDFLRAEGIRVMVSLDGMGRENDEQRPFTNGRPSSPFVLKTIAQLIKQGHPPHLSITITDRSAGGLAELVRFALERDLTFSLNFFRDNEHAAGFTQLHAAEGAIISGLLDAFAVIEEFLPRWSVLGSILDRGQLLEPRQRSCGVGQDYLVIDQRGGVAKCHMEIEKTVGDVFSGDDLLRLVREDRSTAVNPSVEEKEGCRGCSWRYWCTGGCTVATFRATGRFDIKSPNCGIYKAIYPEALRLEALRLLKYAAPEPEAAGCGRSAG